MTSNKIELIIAEKSQKITEFQELANKTKDSDKLGRLNQKINAAKIQLDSAIAYKDFKKDTVVCNGSKEKLGKVISKEIQNKLPVIWVDWGSITSSHVPGSLTVIPLEQLVWHWIDGEFTRLYDRESCNDIQVLFEELERLKTEAKLLVVTSSPVVAIEKNQLQQQKIIKLWQDTITSHFPRNSGFFLHNRKVVVKSHQLSKQHNLVFPVVFDGQCKHLVHPLELKKIPLGQTNIFPEDNTDPNEPPEKEKVAQEILDSDNSANNDGSSKLIIDSEFKSLIPPLDSQEKKQLEQSLIAEGCRNSLVIWKGHNILIDGHNRYEICIKHNLSYRTVEIDLRDRDSVINWMISNQLGRRNLKPDVAAYLRGKLYRNLKKQHGGDRNKAGINQHTQSLINDSSSSGHFDHLTKTPKTSSEIAKLQGVSEATVRRDAKYSEAVEAIASKVHCSPQDIINSPLSKKQVKEMVNFPVESIKHKLENPSFIESRELPELKPGDVVKIKSDRSNRDLIGYNGSYAIIDRVSESSVDIRIWQKLITQVHKQFLISVETEKIVIKASVSQEQLLSLMEKYNSLEDAISHSDAK